MAFSFEIFWRHRGFRRGGDFQNAHRNGELENVRTRKSYVSAVKLAETLLNAVREEARRFFQEFRHFSRETLRRRFRRKRSRKIHAVTGGITAASRVKSIRISFFRGFRGVPAVKRTFKRTIFRRIFRIFVREFHESPRPPFRPSPGGREMAE